jgi:hypothetical protein
MALGRLIRVAAGVVAALIVIGIILRVLSANPHNVIVSDIHDAGRWLVGPFHNVFSVKGAKLDMGLNWGLAALVYLLVGAIIARLVTFLAARRPGMRGFGGRRRARPVA